MGNKKHWTARSSDLTFRELSEKVTDSASSIVTNLRWFPASGRSSPHAGHGHCLAGNEQLTSDNAVEHSYYNPARRNDMYCTSWSLI